ncbi:TetR/AcrR family transcriptional regulator [Bacillus sp. FJAT-28004]|uniref:TetR/AcrR family transcriptional regulator n=1 Tax=Bacillus sp. FJAT-28004 TaxID=1679165 RepID=UPI0039C937A0
MFLIDRIMKAFIEEIHNNGIKFTMDDLASRLGISKRTLYEHFPSKVSILDAIIEQTLSEFDVKTALIVQDTNLSIIEKIRGIVTLLTKHYELYDIRILEQMKRYYPEQWKKIDDALTDDWDALRSVIEQGIHEGIIVSKNISIIMKLMIDAANSTLDQRFYQKNDITLTEALSTIVDIILFGLVPRDTGGE